MSEVDEQKLLGIEKIRQDIQLNMKKFDIEQQQFNESNQLNMKKFDVEQQQFNESNQLNMKKFDVEQQQFNENHQLNMKKFDVELSKKHYEAWRLAFYGVAVGAGGTFAIAKTLQVLGL